MALPATDNFNRANGAIGANWTAVGNASSNPGFLVSLNACKANTSPGGGVAAFAFWNADVFGNSHYSQATYASTGNMGLCVCLKDNGSGKANGYSWRFNTGVVSLVSNGSLTTILSGVSTPAVGSVCKMEMVKGVDGTINLYDDGALIGTIVDDTFTGGSPGIFGTSGNAGTLDDWRGDNVSSDTFLPTAYAIGRYASQAARLRR